MKPFSMPIRDQCEVRTPKREIDRRAFLPDFKSVPISDSNPRTGPFMPIGVHSWYHPNSLCLCASVRPSNLELGPFRSHSVHTAFTLFTLFFKGGRGPACISLRHPSLCRPFTSNTRATRQRHTQNTPKTHEKHTKTQTKSPKHTKIIFLPQNRKPDPPSCSLVFIRGSLVFALRHHVAMSPVALPKRHTTTRKRHTIPQKDTHLASRSERTSSGHTLEAALGTQFFIPPGGCPALCLSASGCSPVRPFAISTVFRALSGFFRFFPPPLPSPQASRSLCRNLYRKLCRTTFGGRPSSSSLRRHAAMSPVAHSALRSRQFLRKYLKTHFSHSLL